MSNKNYIYDNKDEQTVANFLKENLRDDHLLQIATAYFSFNIYNKDSKLKTKLDNIEHLNIIIGSLPNEKDFNKNEHTFFIKNNLLEENSTNHKGQLDQLESLRQMADWLEKKADIKTINSEDILLHSKIYHLQPKNVNEKQEILTGSSNFTCKGLGLIPTSNIELNVHISEDNLRDSLNKWFKELWHSNLLKDIKEELLATLRGLYQPQVPYVLYKYMLSCLAGNDKKKISFTEEDKKLEETKLWNTLYSFQKYAVNSLINRLNDYGGAFLTDDVGLGKTFTALAIIKYYLNAKTRCRVLVLVPKRLKKNWELYDSNGSDNPFTDDDIRFEIFTHSNFYNEWRDNVRYDLIVIDESHNFKNNATRMYKQLKEKIGSAKPHILMLSATPVSINLEELLYQIDIIPEIEKTYEEKNGIKHSEIIKQNNKKFMSNIKETMPKVLSEVLDQEYFSLLDNLGVGRNREQIKLLYKDDKDKVNFPEVDIVPEDIITPTSYHADDWFSLEKFVDTVIDKLEMVYYTPLAYIKEEHLREYVDGDTYKTTEKNMVWLMKSLLCKRLESSVKALEETLDRMTNKLKARLDELENKGQLFSNKVENDDDEKNDDDDILEDVKTNYKKNEFNPNHFKSEYTQLIKNDYDKLNEYYNSIKAISINKDVKFQTLLNKIKEIDTKKYGNKVLIFSSAIATVDYLYENFKEKYPDKNIAKVSGSGTCASTTGLENYNTILQAFSPISKNYTINKAKEIDYLIATNCISEGQNLQDCGVLFNYDIDWNPIRLIQRSGRIDRIGNLYPSIKIMTFQPTKTLDEYLNLLKRVSAREELMNIKPKDIQILEDALAGITSSNLITKNISVEFYLQGLDTKEVAKPQPAHGAYAVVKSSSTNGVVFFLKYNDVDLSLERRKELKRQNAFYPYYLVKISSDNVINQQHFSKQVSIIDLLKNECLDKKEADLVAHKELEKTLNGKKLNEVYSDKLGQAIKYIQSKTSKEIPVGGMFQTMQEQENIDKFELITWFVLL